MKKFILFILMAGLGITITGCAITRPLTVLERRALESRDLRCSYENAYRATITVLQDKGFNITNSDYQGGIVSGTTGKQVSRTAISGILANLYDISKGAYNAFEITVTLEKYTDEITKMRIVLTQHMYNENRNHTGSRRLSRSEALQEYYGAIQKEIFMREQLEKK